MPQPLRVIDSHTGGEPTRVVIDGLPALAGNGCQEKRGAFRASADWVRTALTLEPRGADWMVGAAIVPSAEPDATTGVIFFNNVGYLGMCGHGLIGLVTTLEHLGRIGPGRHCFETPVGKVSATLHEDHSVSIENVLSYRAAKAVTIEVPEIGMVTGDIAYGGNWFFLAEEPRLCRTRVDEHTTKTKRILSAIRDQNVGVDLGAAIDHIELIAAASDPSKADAQNFVLCPGGHYDRSPCGTGTSAKVACLAADGTLEPGQTWRQESIMGSLFEASYQSVDGGVMPTIRGRAFVTAETTMIFDDEDIFARGIPAEQEPR